MRIVITRTEITTNNDGLYITSLSITDFTFNKESWSSKLIYTVNTKYVDPNIKETAEYKLVETYNYSYTYYE